MNLPHQNLIVRALGMVFANMEALRRVFWAYVWASVAAIAFMSPPYLVLPVVVAVGVVIGVMEKCQGLVQGKVYTRPKYSFWSASRLYTTIVAGAWGFGWLVTQSPAAAVDVYTRVLGGEMIPGFVTAFLAPVLGSMSAEWVFGIAPLEEENGHASA